MRRKMVSNAVYTIISSFFLSMVPLVPFARSILMIFITFALWTHIHSRTHIQSKWSFHVVDGSMCEYVRISTHTTQYQFVLVFAFALQRRGKRRKRAHKKKPLFRACPISLSVRHSELFDSNRIARIQNVSLSRKSHCVIVAVIVLIWFCWPIH